MKKYDTYKDSGVEWIGEIPEHWDLKKMKYSVEKIDEIIQESNLLIAVENIESGTGRLIGLEKKNNYEGHINGFKKGDVIFNKLRPYLSKVYRAEKDGGCFGELLILRGANEQMENGFLFYLMFSKPFIDNVDSSTHGTKMPRANWDSFIKQMGIPIPSFEEQTQIANYLDQKTTEIETLIAKKEQLIKLLEEERTAMISQAVTKGLDPNVPMKDSGIDWLGEIPEHWEVARVKHFTKKIGSGVTPRGGAEVYQDAGVPLLRSQNIYFDGLKLDNVAFISNEIHDSMNNSKVLKGDVLLNITGGSIGRCYYLSDEYKEVNVNQHVCIIRPNSRISTKYLYLLISSEIGQNQIRICQQGGNREALNFEQLKGFPFALPSIQEQLKIIEVIDNKKEVMDHSVNKVTQEINLLKEYKTALISEVVTGKIDIRQEVLN